MNERFVYANDRFGPRVRDMNTGRWMGVDLVQEMAAVIPTVSDLALKAARDEGFNAGTIAALAVLAAHDSEVQWREVLHAAGEAQVLYHAAHVEPEDWKWAGFSRYKLRRPAKRTANKEKS
jgi:hypothetical protein